MERVPCVRSWDCPVLDQKMGCHEDIDHKYGPRRAYRTQVEREFRELDVNKRLICRRLHDEHHATEEFPKKPTREYMLRIINEEARRVANNARNGQTTD